MDPASSTPDIVAVSPISTGIVVAYVECTVQCGFPSPAEENLDEGGLDLSRRFVRHPSSTFVVQAAGDSLTGVGIHTGDYLLVDRSKTPRHGDVVIAIIDGSFTAKIFHELRGHITLQAAHSGYQSIPWADGCEIFGVVTSVHRDLTKLSTCSSR